MLGASFCSLVSSLPLQCQFTAFPVVLGVHRAFGPPVEFEAPHYTTEEASSVQRQDSCLERVTPALRFCLP